MLFVAFAIAITVGIALAISADFGAVFGLTQDQTGRIIPLVVILTLVASALVSRRHRLRDIVGGFVAWIAIGMVIFAGYTFRDDLSHIGRRMLGAFQPGAAVIDPNTGSVLIGRAFGGSFRVDASINGADIPMIFDTGATAVVLSSADAERAGLDIKRLNYSISVQTANGVGSAAAAVIDEIRIGNIVRNNVRAYVLQDGALETSLLGMTFLETLSRYSVSRDSLELHD